jgi:hypothetical protein
VKEITGAPQTYLLDTSNDDVRLSVAFGDGQSGDSDVELDGVLLASGSLRDLMLGSNKQLKAAKSTIIVRSLVDHTNDNTNHLSVVYDLKGGDAPARIVVTSTFDKGPSASIKQVIKFS